MPRLCAVLGDRIGEVGEEAVGDLQVVRRQHQVQAALLAVEVPAAVVHHVADAADVDRDVGRRVGGELHDGHVGLRP